MQFKSTTKSVKQIGSDLGASHVLEGSVRRVGERVRITAQLIRVIDESHLWAQSYERGLHDVLEVQAEVARAVARELQIKLTPHEKRRLEPDKPRSINPQAYELYLRGRHFWYRRTEEGMRKSIECFEEALRYDPSFAAAYDGISDAHTMLACRGITPAFDYGRHRPMKGPRQSPGNIPLSYQSASGTTCWYAAEMPTNSLDAVCYATTAQARPRLGFA